MSRMLIVKFMSYRITWSMSMEKKNITEDNFRLFCKNNQMTKEGKRFICTSQRYELIILVI